MRKMIAFILIVMFAAPSYAVAQERLALLIGNSRYEQATALRNPENDVDLVHSALELAGFETIVVKNANKTRLDAQIDSFLSLVATKNNPTVLIYFAGHGVQFDGRNYLLPVDTDISSKHDIVGSSLGVGELLSRVEDATSGFKIIVLDACRDDPFQKTRGLNRGLARLTPAQRPEGSSDQGTLIAYSTKPGAVAVDGDSGFSPYAAAFAEAIIMPRLELEEAFKRVRATVRERTSGEQITWEEGSMIGSFRFVDSRDNDRPDSQEMNFWELASIANTPESMVRYLKEYPDGIFASLARQKAEAMNRDFSFIKQNEVFPVVSIDDRHVDLCHNPQHPGFNFAPSRPDIAEYDQMIIYVIINISLDNIACDGVLLSIANMLGANHSHELADARGLSAFIQGVDFTMEVTKAGNHQRLGDCEAMCLDFEGLVRVHYTGAEEHFGVSLVAVDPAEYGLTYKWENTKSRLGELILSVAAGGGIAVRGSEDWDRGSPAALPFDSPDESVYTEIDRQEGDDYGSVAIAASDKYFSTWSDSNAEAIAFLEHTYAPQVDYFGTRVAKSEVMREKSAFVERWPQRTYTVRPGVSALCENDVCRVQGVVDWHVYSPARDSTSVGTASFVLSFDVGGLSPTLVSEMSSVLARQLRKGR